MAALSASPFYRLFAGTFVVTLLGGCMLTRPDLVVQPAEMAFAFVPGGQFTMGSEASPDSQPTHQATVPDLFVGMFEVTFEQYDQFCKATGRPAPDDEEWGRENRPVINVSWHDATVYAAWLSQQTGSHFRLPSETEWEYFARAGSSTRFWTGDSLTKNSENCRDCGDIISTGTTPVGTFSANPWKLYDVLGNVQEWCLDDYQNSYTNFPVDGKPLTLEGTAKKSIRGGAWLYAARELGTAMRDYNVPTKNSRSIGFRLVLEPGVNVPAPKSR